MKNESGEFHPIKCDLTIEEDILAAFQWTRNNLGGVNLLVNNAGTLRNTSLTGEFCKINKIKTYNLIKFFKINTEGKTSDWKTVIDLNLLGLCIATREAVKIMTEKNVAGLIIHINSVAGHYPIPSFASQLNVYGATKYGVTNLAETLRLELAAKKSNIRVTSLSPGYVESEILDVAGFGSAQDTDKLFSDAPILKPVDISNAILYLMSTPPSVNVRFVYSYSPFILIECFLLFICSRLLN